MEEMQKQHHANHPAAADRSVEAFPARRPKVFWRAASIPSCNITMAQPKLIFLFLRVLRFCPRAISIVGFFEMPSMAGIRKASLQVRRKPNSFGQPLNLSEIRRDSAAVVGWLSREGPRNVSFAVSKAAVWLSRKVRGTIMIIR